MKHFSLVLVMVLLAIGSTFAQRTITGIVTLEDGEEAIGANVIVVGSDALGTSTEYDGTFSIDVPSDATELEVSYAGYATQIVSIVGVDNITVLLAVESELLEVVEVTTRFYKKTRAETTGSVEVVGSEKIERIPIPTFDNILQGQVSGLQIMAGTGQPGNGAGKVQLRGAGSILGSSEPVYYMDGVPIDPDVMSNINPSDIESVQVLKDASAIALYGARGANGVILITTKSGKMKADQPTRITYRTQYGLTTPTQERFTMMNSAEKLAFELYQGTVEFENGIGDPVTGPTTAQYRPGFWFGSPESPGYNPAVIDSMSNVNTDWTDFFFRTAIMKQHDLAVSGGSEKTSFYVSASYLDQEGQTIRSDLKRASTRFNIDHQANDRLKFGFRGTIGYSRRNFVESENSVSLSNPFTAVYLANPYENPFNPDGSYNIARPIAANPSQGLSNSVNVIELTERATNVVDELKGVGNIYAEFKIIDGLKVRSQWGMDYTEQTDERWLDPLSVRGSNPNSVRGGQGSFAEGYLRQPQWIGTNTLSYDKKFADGKHKIFALVGGELQRSLFRSFGYTGYGLDPKLPTTAASITSGFDNNDFIASVGGSKTQRSNAAYFFNADYIYSGKYIVSGSIRREAVSAFGENFRWGNFWSVSAGWNISDEEFAKNLSWLDRAKLSISYGVNGNSEGIGNFESRSLYGTGTYGDKATYTQATIGRPDLKWEELNQANLRLEFGFLKRINGTLDLYNNVTSDLFLQQSLSSAASGAFGAVDINSGKMRNRGVELNMNVDVLNVKGFTWSVNGNLAYNDNEITDLGGEDEFEFGTSIAKEGLPFNTHFIVGYAGVDPANGQPLYYDLDGNVTNVYSAANNATIYGTPEPPLVGGFGTSLGYKGLVLSATFSFVRGNTLFNNQTFFQQNHNFVLYNLSTEMNDIWKNPGDVTEFQGIIDPVTGGRSVREFSSRDIEDGSFLRFRNLSLSYSLPKDIFKGYLKDVTVFAQAQNLFTVTQFTGFDPEIDNNIAQYEYPVPRTFTFGLEVGF